MSNLGFRSLWSRGVALTLGLGLVGFGSPAFPARGAHDDQDVGPRRPGPSAKEGAGFDRFPPPAREEPGDEDDENRGPRRGPEGSPPRPSSERRDGPPPPPHKGRRGPGGFDGPPAPHHPLMFALDVDEDGELSAREIKNASKALLKLDRNGDGELSHSELRPPRPEGPMRRPEFGRGGPDGPPHDGPPPGGPPPKGEDRD